MLALIDVVLLMWALVNTLLLALLGAFVSRRVGIEVSGRVLLLEGRVQRIEDVQREELARLLIIDEKLGALATRQDIDDGIAMAMASQREVRRHTKVGSISTGGGGASVGGDLTDRRETK